jgi:hypothetical protein
MRESISSSWLLLGRVILPISFSVAAFAVLVVFVITSQSEFLILVGVLVFFASVFFVQSVLLHDVLIDGDRLYVRRFGNEIEIPVKHIIRVSEVRWHQSHLVTIHLDRSQSTVKSIRFIPKWSGLYLFRSHPVVHVLRLRAGLLSNGGRC